MLAQQESITQLLHLFEDARAQSDAALMQLLMMDPDRSLYQLQHAQEAGDRAVKAERCAHLAAEAYTPVMRCAQPVLAGSADVTSWTGPRPQHTARAALTWPRQASFCIVYFIPSQHG